jgi:acetyl esterase
VTLDPQIAALLPALNEAFPRVETMTAPQLRAVIRQRAQALQNPEPVGRVVDRSLPGADGDINVRIYWPSEPFDTLPTIVFAHGGGFVFCDLDSHDDLCRAMTNGVRAIVLSVDYRLAPEFPWPAAVDDVYAVTDWTASHAEELGGDPTRLVVAGDSAGGNLATVTALVARDHGSPAIAGQLLIYPSIAADFDTRSYRDFGTGYYNTATAMAWYWDQYVPNRADRSDFTASPLKACLAGLPPAVVITAGFDPLCSEGESYAKALAEAGVPTVHRNYAGGIHGFMTMPSLDICAQARRQAWVDVSRSLE